MAREFQRLKDLCLSLMKRVPSNLSFHANVGGMALVLKEPYGVVVGMAPWNAALLLGFRAVCAPIACGNTVVYETFLPPLTKVSKPPN